MSAPDAPRARPVPVLGVRRGRAFVVVDPAAILYVSSRGGLTTLYTADGREAWSPLTLTALAARLDPVAFLRLDASHVVNLLQLAGLVPEAGQRYSLIFRDAKSTTLTVSRDVGRRLRAALGW